LDENLLSRKLKQPLIEIGHVVQNVDNMGWRGIKDAPLLDINPLMVTSQKPLVKFKVYELHQIP